MVGGISKFWNFLGYRTEPRKSQELAAAEEAFSKIDVKALYKDISESSSPQDKCIDKQVLIEKCGLQDADQQLQNAVCGALQRHAPTSSGCGQQSVPVECVVIAKAKAERLSDEDSMEFAFSALENACPSGEGVSARVVQQLVASCLRLVFEANGYQLELNSDYVHSIAAGLFQLGDGQQPAEVATLDMFKTWSKSLPVLYRTLSSLLSRFGASQKSPPISLASDLSAATADQHSNVLLPVSASHLPPGLPRLPELNFERCKQSDALLSSEFVWALSQSMPPDLRVQWRLLYNSYRCGVYFSTTLGTNYPKIRPSIFNATRLNFDVS